MKRKFMILASVVCASALALSWNNLRAQSDPAAPAALAPAPPGNPSNPSGVFPPANPNGAVPPATTYVPEQRPGAPGRARMPHTVIYQRALIVLQQTQLELEHSTNEFDGHRQPALEACERAITEVKAIMKSAGIQPMFRRTGPPPPDHIVPTPLQAAPAPPAAPAAPGQ